MGFIQRHKAILIVLGVIIVFVAIIIGAIKWWSLPRNVIKRTININLPYRSKVIYYDFEWISQSATVKIAIDSEFAKAIEPQLDEFLDNGFEDNLERYETEFLLPPGIKRSPCWQILHEEDVKCYGSKYLDPKPWWKPNVKHMALVWIFISEEEGQYYLYMQS